MRIPTERRVVISTEAEKSIGLAFLEGQSVSDIAQFYGVSRRTIEAVIRAALEHLIEAKRPDPDPAMVARQPVTDVSGHLVED